MKRTVYINMKRHYNIGKNNGRYKNGKSHCIVCDKELNYYKKGCTCRDCMEQISKEKETCKCGNHKSKVSEVCIKCDSIRKSLEFLGNNNPMFGKEGILNPNYKDGRTVKEYKCKECNNIIHYHTANEGTGLCSSCSRKGKRNFRYIDGRSSEIYPPEFNNILRLKILIRDKYKCTECGMTNRKHKSIFNRNLEIHHKDSDKYNNTNKNLTTLCKYCHQDITLGRKLTCKIF